MEIPVKKTSGIPWWVWLIAALLIGALLWWLLAGRDEDPAGTAVEAEPVPAAAAPAENGALAPIPAEGTVVTPQGGAPAEGATVAGGTITDLSTITTAENPAALVGREFQLSGIRVLDVVGDRTYWVGSGPDQRVFAALQEVPPPGFPTDADININPNQTIAMRGVIRSASDGALAGRPLQDMPPGTQIVLYAQTAEVLKRP